MSRIIQIKDRILQLGAGEFQNLMDELLSKLGKYGKIQSLGMKPGTAKTTKGTPDTYFVRDNGNYIFAEYTAQDKRIYEKLKSDIEKCIDTEKTGISLDKIDGIVCCHTSSNLKPADYERLVTFCKDKGIELEIFGIDEIARLVCDRFPSLARDFLGITMDTNQILEADDFIREYDSSETAAPLDTVFLFREEECRELTNNILNHKVTIVFGSAGVGKTRLCLETVRKVAKNHSFQLLCVKSNSQDLYEDFLVRVEKPGKYLFFIDDANELIGLQSILSYVNKGHMDYDFRMVLTVRNYVKDDVVRDVQRFTYPAMMEISRFSDDQIKAFLKENFEIRNEQYTDQIIRIAEGNPRIAYMAGRIAKSSDSLESISDISEIYRCYYDPILSDTLHYDQRLCITAGILSLLHVVLIEHIEKNIENLLITAHITAIEFRDSVFELSRMEVVDIQKEMIASISDQCLGNYMLYYVFADKRLVPLSDILYVGFLNYKDGIIRSLDTLINLFDNESLRNYLEEEITKTWNRLKKEKASVFDDYARAFHTEKPEEAFLIAEEKIASIVSETEDDPEIDFEKGTLETADDYLGYLTGYSYTKHLETAMQLLLRYIGKGSKYALIGFSWLKNNYGIDLESLSYDFYDEPRILETFSKAIGFSYLTRKFILAYLKYILGYSFSPSRMGRGGKFQIYQLPLHRSEGVKAYRKKAWEVLGQLARYSDMRSEIQDVLSSYAGTIRIAEDSSLVSYDKPFAEKIIDLVYEHDLKRDMVCHKLNREWRHCEVSVADDAEAPYSKEWELFQIIGDIRQTFEHSEERSRNIQQYANTLTRETIPQFLDAANKILNAANQQEIYPVSDGIQHILETVSAKEDLCRVLLDQLLIPDSKLTSYSKPVLDGAFKSLSASELWDAVSHRNYLEKNLWQYAYFSLIPQTEVDERTYKLLLDYFKSDDDKDIREPSYRSLAFLKKFRQIDPAVFVTVSRIILQKQIYNPSMAYAYLSTLFIKQCVDQEKLLGYFQIDQNLLFEIYMFVVMQGCYDDNNGDYLNALFKVNSKWAPVYIEYEVARIKKYQYGQNFHRLASLWSSDNYMEYFDLLVDEIADSENSLINWYLAQAFASMRRAGTEKQTERRLETWAMHYIDKNYKSKRVVSLFWALLNMDDELREKAYKRFLSQSDDFDLFRKIPLDSPDRGGSLDSAIPSLHHRIGFLEKLLEAVHGINYLKHAQRIRDAIAGLEREIEQEEVDQIYRKLYRS